MKKILFFALSALLLVACGEKQKEPETKTLTLTVSPGSLSYEAEDASAKFINVTTTGSWTATPAGEWIKLDKYSGSGNASITVKVEAQEGEFGRTANILFISSLSGQEKQASVTVSQKGNTKPPVVEIVPQPAAFDGHKRASTTYQLLVYSFADSNGDGVGDFKGIKNHLDYLDGLGVTALWLSPAHPTNSYHGYDVNDYFALNPKFGTEADFKELIDKAHEKGIKIYMDYVLNHSGTGTEWFQSVKADPKNSPYRDYYVLSNGDYPSEAIGGMGGWVSLGDGKIGYKGRLHFKVDWTGGTKYVTVTETTEAAQSPNTSNPERWIHIGSKGSLGLYKTADNIYEITLDVDTDWGFLVRTSNDESWPAGTKYGGKAGKNVITFGQPFPLDNSTAADIVFGETTSYYASFDASMPDLNYGKADECENSRAFQSTVESAAKWVNMGVDGFRLDAVIWIYASSVTPNVKFLDKWYKAVNAVYKAAGHSDDIFMVGEAWQDHNDEKKYYKGLISNFEFNYGGMVSGMLGNQNATGYVDAVNTYVTDHTAQKADAITSFFLTNHDQDRFAEWVGKSEAKEKQAGALLLSTPGKPFVYQGEELGYSGKKGSTDAPVRQPIAWDASLTDLPKFALSNNHKSDLTDYNMIKAHVVTDNPVLEVYQTWSRLRNTYPALASGEMTKAGLSGSSIASWYMTSGSQKLLVIHNVATSEKKVTVTDSMEKPIALLGTASYTGTELTLGPNSSVVFEL